MDRNNIVSSSADILDVFCSCGWEGLALVPDLRQDYYALCKQCGKKIYGVNCPKCQAGYAYPEDDKNVNKQEMTWKCCDWISLSSDAQNNFCESYNSEKELPGEIRGILAERRRLGREALIRWWPLWILILAPVILIFYFDFKDIGFEQIRYWLQQIKIRL